MIFLSLRVRNWLPVISCLRNLEKSLGHFSGFWISCRRFLISTILAMTQRMGTFDCVMQCVSSPSVITRCFYGENILTLAWTRLLKNTVPHQRCQRTSCFLFPTAAAWSWHFVRVIYAITAPLRTDRTPGEFSLTITSPLGTQMHITITLCSEPQREQTSPPWQESGWGWWCFSAVYSCLAYLLTSSW